MPNSTLRRFDDDAISHIFSVLKANLGQKTDAFKLSYDPNPANEYSYFVVNTTGGATATNTINAEKIADTLNDLYSLVKVNGTITLSNNTYSGTGNAVAASDLATIFTSLLTTINGKIDQSAITNTITAGSTDIPTAGAVASAIAGVGGVSFYKCKTAQETSSTDEFSKNSQTFTGDSHGTPTTGTIETSYPYTLTESPKKINSVTYNGQQIKYEYNATTHIITITLPNPNPPTTTAPSASDTLIVNYVPYPIISGTPQSNTFYLVPNDGTGTDNIYNEYVWINNAWELIGSTENDFSQYVKYEDLDVITVEELTSLFTAATPANVQSGS